MRDKRNCFPVIPMELFEGSSQTIVRRVRFYSSVAFYIKMGILSQIYSFLFNFLKRFRMVVVPLEDRFLIKKRSKWAS